MKDALSTANTRDEDDHEVDLAHGFRSIRLEPAQVVGALSIHPLVLTGNPGAPFQLLHEALASNALEVLELGHGMVNVLLVRNHSDRPVLILEGESVQGAKQNRLVTVDLLLAAGAEVPLSVGCVEPGRWDRSAKPFVAAEMSVEPRVRRHARIGSSPDGKPDQVRLWEVVAQKLGSSGTHSESGDYLALQSRFKERVVEIAELLDCHEGQVGLLATQHGRLVGFDMLGHPRNWDAVAQRISHSYVLGSLHGDDEDDGQPTRTAEEWLETIAGAKLLPEQTPGLGRRFALDDRALVGGGLWHAGRIAHLAAFGFART